MIRSQETCLFTLCAATFEGKGAPEMTWKDFAFCRIERTDPGLRGRGSLLMPEFG